MPGLHPILETSIRYHVLVVSMSALLENMVRDQLVRGKPVHVHLAKLKVTKFILRREHCLVQEALGKQDNFPPWNTLGKSHKYIKYLINLIKYNIIQIHYVFLMFSQCGNLFRDLNVLQKFSGLEDVWNTFCILAKNNTLLMDTLCNILWETLC